MESPRTTVKQAKQEAVRKAIRVVEDPHPYVVCWRGLVGLAWKSTEGWHTVIIDPNDPPLSYRVCGSSSDPESWKWVKDSLLLRLAQIAYRPVIDEQETVFEFELIPGGLSTSGKNELRSWMEFQRRYERAKFRGASDIEAHSAAKRDPFRSDLWHLGDKEADSRTAKRRPTI